MLWMAKSETYGCDAHSSRCTQLSIDMTLAAEHNRVGVYFLRRHSSICAERVTIWGMSVECWHKEKGTRRGRRYYRWDCLHHQRSPTSIANMRCTS